MDKKEKQRLKMREWRAAHKNDPAYVARRKAENKRWRDANLEKAREKSKLYYKQFRERQKEAAKQYRKDNKDTLANYWRKKHIYDKYGLRWDEYLKLIENGCEICGTKEKLCVDHCHETNEVRGCLCNLCNQALGRVQESPRIVIKLYNYIMNKCQERKVQRG